MSDRAFATVIASLLVVAAAASRVVPHPWNFTPMIAVALFAGARLGNVWLAIAATLGCLALGDLAVGVFPYEGMVWVYGSLALVVAVGRTLRARNGVVAPLVAALGGGFAFFVITNLAVFASPMYPHTAAGLGTCFTAALPFYRNQIAGDLVFTGALFGLHAAALTWRARAIAAA